MLPDMGRLRVSTEDLLNAGRDLRVIAREFDVAERRGHTVAAAVGHTELADKLRHFANGWDGRRAEMLEEIARLADACTGIGENFERLDSELAAAMRGEA